MRGCCACLEILKNAVSKVKLAELNIKEQECINTVSLCSVICGEVGINVNFCL